jgi:serine/threonine-protein kinase
VWIIVFPLLAPNTPRKILIASLVAASTAPAVVAARWAAGVDMERSVGHLIVFFASRTYLCAILAYVIARIVYRYGVRLRKAREIGSYELVKQIGQGGMGEVWLGRHRMLARPAAVKLIRPELLGNDQRSRDTAVRRFEREAQATATLRSTHTIDVYDFGVTEDGAFFYVMEFLEGLSLDTIVKRFGPLGVPRAIHLIRQVCHSLGEAHARGIVHRDIKPANIFSCRLGPDCDFVKVLDFGLVKQTSGEEETGAALTAQGVTAGTPGFMAPEMALSQVDVDGRADIYALGCVAYWLLTGEYVFKGETPVATMLAHVREEPLPPSARTEIHIPAPLDNAILACLAKDPAARPQTTAEVIALLDAIDVPPWTDADARRWWALHGPLGTLAAVEAEDRSPAAVVYAKR